MSKHHSAQKGSVLTLAAVLLGSLALPVSAQNQPVPRTAPERHFTIPPDIPTAVVLQTEPDAACDLHAAGVYDPAHTMRLYGNIEGYVRFHFTPIQDIQDVYLQLDCTTQAAVTNHPLHLRIAQTPTEDMPAPQGSIPAPKGSKIRPALTDEAALQLSDQDIIALGYPPRPDASKSPDAYAAWLDRVSRVMTILPQHSVPRSVISHGTRNVQEGFSGTSHWSGFEAEFRHFTGVAGEWRVPFVSPDPSGQPCFSSIWVGFDGDDGFSDLMQAGTEQDTVATGSGTMTNYYAWIEVAPNQFPLQEVFGVNSSDLIEAQVWLGDSSGNIDPNGDFAWFNVTDVTTSTSSINFVSGAANFAFLTAEWIVERPFIGGGVLPELSKYGSFGMVKALALSEGTTFPYSSIETVQWTMRENFTPHADNNVLSTASKVAGHPDWINFFWKNFH